VLVSSGGGGYNNIMDEFKDSREILGEVPHTKTQNDLPEYKIAEPANTDKTLLQRLDEVPIEPEQKVSPPEEKVLDNK